MIEVGPQDTLDTVLDRAGISLRCPPQGGKTYGGHRSHLFCPKCNGGTKREKNFFVTIDDDGKGATWICWRSNSCGYADGFRLHGARRQTKRAASDRVATALGQRLEVVLTVACVRLWALNNQSGAQEGV